jgi:putative transposase
MDGFKLMDGVYVYFVTFTIIDWLPVFINPEPTQIIVDSLRFCIREKGLRINAYVIMPNHLHMILFDGKFDNENLQPTLADRDRQIWQPGWHAEGLASEDFWKQKMDYIHENPVRKGYVRLPEHWRYSSAGYWINGEDGDVPLVPLKSEEE